jgi:NitT/TauT family transport system substrate-binding protein
MMSLYLKPACMLALTAILAGCGSSPASSGEVTQIRIPKGAGGAGFLPLLVMEKHKLIEKYAEQAGIPLQIQWLDLGGPSIMNDALLSGQVDYMAAGPPAFLTLWDRTHDSAKVLGVAALTSLPMYLNVRAEHLKRLEDVTAQDKIAVTAIKVSIPAILMQMYAQQRYGAKETTHFDKYTVSMTHPDAVVALLSGSGAISAHFTSPPFHQREIMDPKVRTILTSTQVMGGSTTFTMLSTTAKFREQNPKVYGVVLQALQQANQSIAADKKMAAELLVTSAGGAGFSVEQIVAILNDPDIRFTTSPENVMKYAEFMHSSGSIQNRPATWKDLFFPEIHGAPGN